MAKLEGVKVIEATGGEITKVTYDGAEYTFTAEKAVANDLILSLEDDLDIDVGAFYVCTGGNDSDVYFVDNGGDSRDRMQDDYKAFRKIEEASELTTFKKGDVVVTLEECGWAKGGQGLMKAGAIGKVKAVNGDKLTVKFGKKQPMQVGASKYRKNFVVRTSEVRLATTEESATIAKKKKKAETITFEGEQYRKVERKAQVGDVVVFNATTPKFNGQDSYITPGKSYLVSGVSSKGSPRFHADDNDYILVYGYYVGRTPETVDVYERVEAEYVPQEGDIVVVESLDKYASKGASVHVGDIGKVGEQGVVCPEGSKILIPGREQDACYVDLAEVRKATPAEVEAYEKALHKASFSVGDYVKIVKSFKGNEGAIAKIIDEGKFRTEGGFYSDFKIEHISGKFVGQESAATADQIVKATEQEVADASKPKLKAGDFVKIIDSFLMSKVVLGETYELKSDEAGRLYVDTPDGKCTVVNKNGEVFGAPVLATAGEVEQALKPKLKAGDFVRFEENRLGITAGKIYEVRATDRGEYYVIDDSDIWDYGVGRKCKYEILSSEEVAKHAETEKWAKIGRKPGEFKKGDAARVLAHADGKKVGEIGIVEDSGVLGESGIGIQFNDGKYVGICWSNEDAELIAPVDARFDV